MRINRGPRVRQLATEIWGRMPESIKSFLRDYFEDEIGLAKVLARCLFNQEFGSEVLLAYDAKLVRNEVQRFGHHGRDYIDLAELSNEEKYDRTLVDEDAIIKMLWGDVPFLTAYSFDEKDQTRLEQCYPYDPTEAFFEALGEFNASNPWLRIDLVRLVKADSGSDLLLIFSFNERAKE